MEVRSEEMHYAAGSEQIAAHLAAPAPQGSYPGVVLIHEIFGLDDHTRMVADRIAAEGYTVLAPHLFSSKELAGPLSAENISAAMKFMMSIPVEKQRDDAYRAEQLGKLDATTQAAITEVNKILFQNRPVDLFVDYLSGAIDHLLALPSASGKIGSAGFCFGGGMSINLGCTGRTDATVIFYGENPNPIEKVEKVKGAVMGLYGGEDTRINAGVPDLVGALLRYKKPLTMRVFPGAYHAFFNSSRPQTHNAAAAGEAWQMLLKFFGDNLKAA